jgi:hypothetical protein
MRNGFRLGIRAYVELLDEEPEGRKYRATVPLKQWVYTIHLP